MRKIVKRVIEYFKDLQKNLMKKKDNNQNQIYPLW